MIRINLITDGIQVKSIVKEQRKNIVISDSSFRRPFEYTDEQYVRWMNLQYLESKGDPIPFHYVVTSTGNVIGTKEDFLQTENEEFSGYNNDLIIYVEENLTKLSGNVHQSLGNLCAMLCLKYHIPSNKLTFLPYEIVNDNTYMNAKNSLKKYIEEKTAAKDSSTILVNSFEKQREELNSSAKQAQFIISDQPLTSKELSDMTGVPITFIESQNKPWVIGTPMA